MPHATYPTPHPPCGLLQGYLSVVLSAQLGYHVLGVESEAARCHGAEARAANVVTHGIGLDYILQKYVTLTYISVPGKFHSST